MDIQKSILSQLDLFKEDLAVVSYENDVSLDLGYCPEFKPQGHFIVTVVKSQDWENPLLRLESHNAAKLVLDLNEGARIAHVAAQTP